MLAIVLVGWGASGQTSKATFEVASVKPATPLGPRGMQADRKGGPGHGDPGMYTCANCPVYWVVSEAFDLDTYEIAAPDWLHEVRFDFAAKIPPGTSQEVFHQMLQNLLAERFRLAVHREKREMPVYELTVAKNGPKFAESAAKDDSQPKDDAPGRLRRDKDGFPILGGGMTMAVVPGHARIRSEGQTMAWFAGMLRGQLHGPVIDATGLAGKYDFELSWAFEENNADGTPASGLQDVYRSALIGALPPQLGLRATQKKGTVEVLVIDHIEKAPSAN